MGTTAFSDPKTLACQHDNFFAFLFGMQGGGKMGNFVHAPNAEIWRVEKPRFRVNSPCAATRQLLRALFGAWRRQTGQDG